MRDLIYFDFEKAASLFSQSSGGLLTEIKKSFDQNTLQNESDEVISKDFKIIESKTLHHDLLIRLETLLFDNDIAIDLNEIIDQNGNSIENIRKEVEGRFCIRADAWCSVENFDQIKDRLLAYNDIAEFIKQAAISTMEKKPEVAQLKAQFEHYRLQANNEKDRNKKNQLINQIKNHEKEFKKNLEDAIPIEKFDNWMEKGLKLWIETFMEGQIHFRFYPLEQNPEFNLISNVKKHCFTDASFDNFLFAYSSRPNIKFTVLGIITSLPRVDELDVRFDPYNVAKTVENDFELGFRKMFSALEPLENILRFSRYPNITIYPIAIYRNLIPTKAENKKAAF
jgi:hypothetical protein